MRYACAEGFIAPVALSPAAPDYRAAERETERETERERERERDTARSRPQDRRAPFAGGNPVAPFCGLETPDPDHAPPSRRRFPYSEYDSPQFVNAPGKS
jgi:hypothetical protein